MYVTKREEFLLFVREKGVIFCNIEDICKGLRILKEEGLMWFSGVDLENEYRIALFHYFFLEQKVIKLIIDGGGDVWWSVRRPGTLTELDCLYRPAGNKGWDFTY